MKITKRETEEFIEWKKPHNRESYKSNNGVTFYKNEDKVEEWNDHYYHGGKETLTKRGVLDDGFFRMDIKSIFGEDVLNEILTLIKEEDKMSKPILGSLKLALGYDCNLNCGFCLQQLSDKQPKLDFDWVRNVMAEEMVLRDVKRLTLTGGEPTHAPYKDTALRIVALAKQLGKETCIFTNGTLLDDAMLGQFHNAGLTRFRVSLYDPIDWDWVSDLMVRFKAFDFPRMAKYTVTKETIDDIDNVLANVANNSGIEWFQVKPYNRVEVPDIDAQYELEPEQVYELSSKLLKFKMDNPQVKIDLLPLCYEFLVDDTIKAEDISPCNCGQGKDGYLVVTPTGDVKICGAYPVALGNVKTDTVTDIWENHQLLKEVRTRTQPDECKDCDHWEKCSKNDCHSATYAKYGDFNHANPQCPKAKKKALV